MILILRLLFFCALVLSSIDAWSTLPISSDIYGYDEDRYVYTSQVSEFGAQNRYYDNTTNLRNCCSKSRGNDLQDEALYRSFFAFFDGSFVTKWGVPKNVANKFPSGWGSKANKKGVGTRWQDPNNPGNGVRIDQGNPNHSLPSQQVDHVIVRQNGQVIGRDGKPIQGSIKENAEQAHIPLNEYQNWKSWDSPL